MADFYFQLKDLAVGYHGNPLIRDINIGIDKGEIVTLIGPNGSGKSTILKSITRQLKLIGGTVFFDDTSLMELSYKELSSKMAVVLTERIKTELMNCHDIVATGRYPYTGRLGILTKRDEELVEEAMEAVHAQELGNQDFNAISDGQRQRVLLARAICQEPEILILDEPTAVLTPQETEKLFNVLRKMRDDGKAIVIITHKMHEVESLSDRVAVLRNGQYIGSMLTKDTTVTEMTNMMVGHAVTLNIERPEPVNPKPRIEVEGLTVRNEEGIVKLKDVSFTANSGEILGIAGISGCGQKELLEAIAGLQVVETGTIHYVEDDGSKEMLIGKDPLKIAEMGVSLSFVPEDRLGMGLVGNMDLTDNMMLRSFRQGHTPFTNRKPSKQLATDVVENLEVVTPGITTPVRRLSGGNVQKVLVGREIASAPTVLLTAYAVRGLDINSSYTIYDLINEQKKKGVAVIFVGEDLDVLMELSDRIMVLCGGEVSGILDARKTDKNEVGMLMTRVGGKEHEGEE